MEMRHLPLVVKANESETSAFPSVAVSRDVNIANFAASLEDSSQVLWCCSVSQVVNLER
jgi:hypothetical protein